MSEAAGLELDDADLYAHAPCGYLSTRADGLIIRVNDTFLEWTGYSRDDLIGVRRFVELLTVGGRLYHETHFMPLLQMQSTASEMAFEILRADGARVPVLVNAVLKRDQAGQTSVVRTAISLATERREYERELLRAKQRAEASEAAASVMARTLQSTLVPPASPKIPGLDVGAVYRPAGSGHEVGGDFYDVFEIAVDDWAVVVGDVCGNGVDAAVVTALARYTCRPPRSNTTTQARFWQSSTRCCSTTMVDVTALLPWLAFVENRVPGRSRCRLPVILLGSSAAARRGSHSNSVGSARCSASFPIPDSSSTPAPCMPATWSSCTPTVSPKLGENIICSGKLGCADCRGEAGGSAQSIADLVLHDVLAYQRDDPRDDIAVVVMKVPSDSATESLRTPEP